MIINGKKVTGLYKYDPEATFTQADLVYKDSTLYVALTEVTSIDPSDEEMSVGKYKIYLGDKCVSLKEYLDYEKTEDTKLNKYIPASLLPVILNHYLTGVDEKGVIEALNDDFRSDTKTTANEILVSPTINHAIYMVDRDLAGLPVDIYSSKSQRVNREKLILKQYTYKEKLFIDSVLESRRIRVQELIDHSQYMVWYRFLRLDDEGSTPSPWKPITLNTSNVSDNLLRLAEEYKSRIDVLQSTLDNLRSNFRYKSLELPQRPSALFIVPDEYAGKSVITLSARVKNGNGIFKIVNFTVDLSSSITKYESDGCYLLVNNKKELTLYEDKYFTIIHRKATICDAYIHEYYGC